MLNFLFWLSKPVIVDGLLYFLIAVFVFQQGYLSSDEADKHINPVNRFWMNFAIGSLAAGLGSLKMFRSKTFSEHEETKKEKENEKKNGTNGIGSTPAK